MDAMGQPLQPGSAVVRARPVGPFAAHAQPFAFFSPPKSPTSPQLSILVRGNTPQPPPPPHPPYSPPAAQCDGSRMEAKAFTSATLESALELLFVDCDAAAATEAFFGHRSSYERFGPQIDDTTVRWWNFSRSSFQTGSRALLLRSRIVAPPWRPNCSMPSYLAQGRCDFFSNSDLSLTEIALPGRLLVLSSSAANATPLRGTHISLYKMKWSQLVGHGVLAHVTDTTTGGDGVAEFVIKSEPAGQFYAARYVAVGFAKDGSLQIGSPIQVAAATQPQKQRRTVLADLILDRALFRSGETVHCSGWVRAYDWQGLDAPTDGLNLTFTTPWGTHTVAVNSLGAAHTSVVVPAGAKLQDYSVSAKVEGPNLTRGNFPYASLTLADPREPSAVLKVSSPPIFKPQVNALQLSLSTKTYLGDFVKGSTVSLRWSAQSNQSWRSPGRSIEIPAASSPPRRDHGRAMIMPPPPLACILPRGAP